MINPGGSPVSKPMFYCFFPSENYHQLTFEAHYVTVVVEVEQSGDPRSRASSEHHIHSHRYQQCQEM